MSRVRALVVVPGRGSYGKHSLGYLRDRGPGCSEILSACAHVRQRSGRPDLHELDDAPSFRASLHLAGEHASLLTAACSLCDYAEIDQERFEIVGVCGNSMGWYSALALSGALPLEDALALIETMGGYQAEALFGGQILYPLHDTDGRSLSKLHRHVQDVLRGAHEAGGRAWWSIDLGTHAVLGADERGLTYLLENLQRQDRGARTFPLRLPMHAAFHTPLMNEVAARALRELASLRFTAPRLPLIDGHGTIYRPRWADPRAIHHYTLSTQVTQTYGYVEGLRTALNYCGPEVVIVLGPGNSLGAPTAAALQREGWRGARDPQTWHALQASDIPVLLSFGLAEQRAQLVTSR
ncbi:MAG: ACP S-malonyltransferase [Deltaproteobacteria bacterium]|nr:MAG: ACP S-malonyltransferase [Deltaproteobacteria bacterium]